MSRGNILSIIPIGLLGLALGSEEGLLNATAIVVSFQTRRGIRSYKYVGVAAVSILAGSDPHDFYGEEL